MNYFGPRQRESDKRWDYTCRNNSWTHPVGYCHKYIPLDGGLMKVSEQQVREHEKSKDKYHSTGHATADEACECYKQYMLNERFYIGEYEDTQHKCRVCGEWTQKYVKIGAYQSFNLCEKHANREEAGKMFVVWRSMES